MGLIMVNPRKPEPDRMTMVFYYIIVTAAIVGFLSIVFFFSSYLIWLGLRLWKGC